jgi:ABC-type sugar transport system permease subunit
MKKIRKIILSFLSIFILISLLISFVEHENAKRQYFASKENYQNGYYKEQFKTIEDVNVNRINTNRYIYDVCRIRFVLDSIIGLFLIAYIFINILDNQNGFISKSKLNNEED